jgi:hypothetical protein
MPTNPQIGCLSALDAANYRQRRVRRDSTSRRASSAPRKKSSAPATPRQGPCNGSITHVKKFRHRLPLESLI